MVHVHDDELPGDDLRPLMPQTSTIGPQACFQYPRSPRSPGFGATPKCPNARIETIAKTQLSQVSAFGKQQLAQNPTQPRAVQSHAPRFVRRTEYTGALYDVPAAFGRQPCGQLVCEKRTAPRPILSRSARTATATPGSGNSAALIGQVSSFRQGAEVVPCASQRWRRRQRQRQRQPSKVKAGYQTRSGLGHTAPSPSLSSRHAFRSFTHSMSTCSPGPGAYNLPGAFEKQTSSCTRNVQSFVAGGGAAARPCSSGAFRREYLVRSRGYGRGGAVAAVVVEDGHHNARLALADDRIARAAGAATESLGRGNAQLSTTQNRPCSAFARAPTGRQGRPVTGGGMLRCDPGRASARARASAAAHTQRMRHGSMGSRGMSYFRDGHPRDCHPSDLDLERINRAGATRK